jgi:hypothetical protein
MGGHDQRFKVLLKEFFREFLLLFFPNWAAGLDFAGLEWLDKELFLDPPSGDVLFLDLLARLPRRDPATGAVEPTLALVHVEVESRESAQGFRRRMYEYHEPLRRKHQGPILPIAVFLRVGLNGLGVETYVETFGDFEVLRFNYLYVGLPGLEAESYLAGGNWLGVALAALMRVPRKRQAWFRGEALRRILLECPENDYRKFLLTECVEAYLGLDEEQQREFERLLQSPPYREIVPMMTTTFEKGIAKGWQEGIAKGKEEGVIEGQRLMLRHILEQRFGPLSAAVVQRLEAWPADRLGELASGVLKAGSLAEMGLGDEPNGTP